jgi:hypothetical protein
MPASSGHHHRPPRVRKLGNPGRLTGPETTPEPVPEPQIGPVGPKRGGTKSARGRIQQQVRAELTPAHQWQPSAGRALCSCGWTPPAGANARAAWRDHVKVLIAREVVSRRNEQGGWRFR